MKNTKDKGIIEFTIFQEKNKFIGACLTFDIVIEGNDYEQVKQDIMDAATLHIETVQELNLSDTLLNRPSPLKYWKKRGSLIPAIDDSNSSVNQVSAKSPKFYEATSYSLSSRKLSVAK